MKRRDLLRGTILGAPLAAGILTAAPAAAQEPRLSTAWDLLDYALGLKYIQAEFYRQGNAAALLSGREADYLNQIGYHKQQHVAALTSAITAAGGSPPVAPGLDFGDSFASRESYLGTGATIEDCVLSAYVGMPVAPTFNTGAATEMSGIFSVDSRAAAVLNVLAGRPIENGVYYGGTIAARDQGEVVAALQPYVTGPWSMAGTAGVTS